MTLEQLLAALHAAGATRVHVELEFAPAHLHADPSPSTLPTDPAPRSEQRAHPQAESHNAQTERADEADPDQQARDLELAHSE